MALIRLLKSIYHASSNLKQGIKAKFFLFLKLHIVLHHAKKGGHHIKKHHKKYLGFSGSALTTYLILFKLAAIKAIGIKIILLLLTSLGIYNTGIQQQVEASNTTGLDTIIFVEAQQDYIDAVINTPINQLNFITNNIDTGTVYQNTFERYNKNLLFMSNFDNKLLLGENANNTGSIKDISLYNNSGTIDGAQRTEAGKHNGSFFFDGDDLVQFQGITQTGSTYQSGLTLSTWIKFSGDQVYSTLINKSSEYNLKIYPYDNGESFRVSFNLYHPQRDDLSLDREQRIFNNDDRYHIVTTYDNNFMKIFVNGELLSQKIATGNIKTHSIGNLVLGKNFKGYIDELQIYNYALTSGEIQQLQNIDLSKINNDQREFTANFNGSGFDDKNIHGIEIEDLNGNIYEKYIDNTLTGDILTGDILTGDILTGDILTGDVLTGDVLTGDILTGDVLTGDVLTGDILTGDVLTGDVLTGDILTGDVLTGDVLTGNILTGNILTGDILTGDTLTGDVLTGGVLTGDVLTGDILTGNVLTGNVLTGDTLTGTILTGDILTGDVLTGDVLTGTILTGDVLTGNVLTGTEPIKLEQIEKYSLYSEIFSSIKKLKLIYQDTSNTINAYNLYDEKLLLMSNFNKQDDLDNRNTKDISIYNNSGTINGASWVDTGKFNGSFFFDGNDTIKFKNIKQTQATYQSGLTLSTWVKFSGDQVYSTLINKNSEYNLKIQPYNNGESFKISFNLYHPRRDDLSLNWNQRILNNNDRYHIVTTYDNNFMKIFVNGELLTQKEATGKIKTHSRGNLLIGKNFNGYLDELQIYAYPLSQDEIQVLHNTSLDKLTNNQRELNTNISGSIFDDITITGIEIEDFSGNIYSKYINLSTGDIIEQTIEEKLTEQGFEREREMDVEKRRGERHLNMKKFNGELCAGDPILIKGTNNNTIEIPSCVKVIDSQQKKYKGIIKKPTIIDLNSLDNLPEIEGGEIYKIIKVGDDTETITFTDIQGNDEFVKVTILVDQGNTRDKLNIYSSQDEIDRTYLSSSYIEEIEGQQFIEFYTPHFTTFALVGQVGEFDINNDDSYSKTSNVILNISGSNITHMRFGNTELERDFASRELFSETKNRILDGENNGLKTVYAEFSGGGGTTTVQDTITLNQNKLIEPGSTSIQGMSRKSITFDKEYISIPVVVATPQTDNNINNYPIPTIKNITTTGFEIAVCVDDGDTTCSITAAIEDIGYFVFDIDWANEYSWIEVGTTNIATDGTTTSIELSSNFANAPILRTTPQTYNQNGNMAAIAWVRDTRTTSSAELIGCVHQGTADACTSGQSDETIGYVAIDTDNVDYSILPTFQNGMKDISNSTWTSISFAPQYIQPTIMVTQNDDDGGQDTQYSRAKNIGALGGDIRYCEQDGTNDCDTHTSEKTYRFAIENYNTTTTPTAYIEYSPTYITGQTTPYDVIATLTGFSKNLITITNNGGSAEYTFTENGNFTFEFIDAAGNTGESLATVSWIDKILPILSFTDDIQALSINTETIEVNYGTTNVKKFKWIDDINDCNGIDADEYNGEITIKHKNHNRKYFCAYAENEAGNSTSVISENPMNLKLFITHTGALSITGDIATGQYHTLQEDNILILSSGDINGSIEISGAINILASGCNWDGTLIPTTIVDQSSPESASNIEIPNKHIKQNIKAGSNNCSSLYLSGIGNSQYFTVKTEITDGLSGDILEIFRSNDGTNRESNPIKDSCLLDENQICTFQTEHLTYFAFGTWTGFFEIDNDNYYTSGINVVLNNLATGATQMRFGNTIGEKDLAIWLEYQPTYSWALNTGDGNKTVYAEFNDGNNYISVEDSIILDTTKPTAIINYNPTSGDYLSGNVTATLTGADDFIFISNNSNSNTYIFTGNGSFDFEFEDLAGNTGETTATVDRMTAEILNINLSPELNLAYFNDYNLSTEISNSDSIISAEVTFEGINGDGGECTSYYTSGSCMPSGDILTLTYSGDNIWDHNYVRPDNIYPQIQFADDLLYRNNAPEELLINKNNYSLMHFQNPFTMTGDTNFWIEFNTIPENINRSRNLTVYIVEKGHDITDFNTNWLNSDFVAQVGSYSRSAVFDHAHTVNSEHHLITLATNSDGTITNSNLDINGDFWIILYNDQIDLRDKGWKLRYQSGDMCDDYQGWYVGDLSNQTTTIQTGGCPDTHVHLARKTDYVDGVKATINAIYDNGINTGTITDSASFYFGEIINLTPNKTQFTSPIIDAAYNSNIEIQRIEALDANNDELTYNIYLLNISGDVINTLITGTTNIQYSFDINGTADGYYSLKGEACDTQLLCTPFYLEDTFIIDRLKPTATLNYTPNSSTTSNVIATLTGFSETGVLITNNGGLQSYTFTGNGNFTFEFEDLAGNTGETTATVSWINNPIYFTGTTPLDWASITGQSTTIEVGIDKSLFNDFVRARSGIDYNLYNSGLIFMSNLDNNSIIGDTSTTVVDISNGGNDGIINGAPIRTIDGKRNGAYTFDGTNDFIEIGNYNLTNFTISTRFYSNQLDNGRRTIIGDPATSFEISQDTSNKINVYSSSQLTSTTTIQTDTRYHLALVKDSAGTKLYINGILENSNTSTSVINSPLNIGMGYNGQYWDGKIDETKIYNYGLSSEDIYQLYLSNLEKSDIDHWNFVSNQTGLIDGVYNYSATINTLSGVFSTDRFLVVQTPDTTPPTAIIEYTPTAGQYTTGNVIATLINFSEPGVIITNNGGLQSYTFTGNGDFIFEFEDLAGNTGETTATVSWINNPIYFTGTTPLDWASITGQSTTIEVGIDKSLFNDFVRARSGTDYNLYNSGLIFMSNLDNNSIIGDTSTTVIDISNGGNNGVINGSPIRTIDGKRNGAYTFDGTNDFIEIGNYNLTNFTISTRFYSNQLDNGRRTIIGDPSTSFEISQDTSNKINVYSSSQLTSTTTIQTDTRYHLALVKDSAGTKLYINGVLENSNTSTSVINSALTIGMGYDGQHWDGKIDETKIYYYGLSSEDIYQLYLSNLEKSDIDHWNFVHNQTGLVDGVYDYSATINTLSGVFSTDRSLIINQITDIIPPTATIEYSIISGQYITGNVIATLTGFSELGVIITNNSGLRYYTFNENGSFTFEFRDATGNTGETTAIVDWMNTNLISIGSPGDFEFTGNIEVKSYQQELTGQFSSGEYFYIDDPLGTDQGWYTTISSTHLSGEYNHIISNNNIFIKSNGIETLSGQQNTGVEINNAMNNYVPLSGEIIYIYRNNATNNNITGKYGDSPYLKLNIPAYQAPGIYNGKLIFTIYEN